MVMQWSCGNNDIMVVMKKCGKHKKCGHVMVSMTQNCGWREYYMNK